MFHFTSNAYQIDVADQLHEPSRNLNPLDGCAMALKSLQQRYFGYTYPFFNYNLRKLRSLKNPGASSS